MKSVVTIYDPPTGWRYGFPKQYRPREGEQLKDTLIRDGYPPEHAEWAAKYCRMWHKEVDPLACKGAEQ
jgi:hypothetical protein